MTYQRFEDLPVWNEAMRLAHRVYDLTENPRFKISFSLRDQIERSVISISDNVAEGFERSTTNEPGGARIETHHPRPAVRRIDRRPAAGASQTKGWGPTAGTDIGGVSQC